LLALPYPIGFCGFWNKTENINLILSNNTFYISSHFRMDKDHFDQLSVLVTAAGGQNASFYNGHICLLALYAF